MIHRKTLFSGAKQSLSISKAIYGFVMIALATVFILAMPGPLMARGTDTSDQWQFMIEPYIWMPSLNASTITGADIDISFNDIIDNLQFTYMMVAGVKKGRWSFLVDTLYLGLEADKDGRIVSSDRIVNTHTEVSLSSWVVTPVIGYNVINCNAGKLDIVGGARYIWVKPEIQVNTSAPLAFNPNFSDSGDNWDGIVGLKGEVSLSERWYLPLYLDIGTGESESTWQAAGGVGYRFSACDVVAGYRYLRWNFDSGPLDDLYISGPYAGVKFKF
jgi:hypothetical protein